MLKEGIIAPDFLLIDDSGKEISLHQFFGKKIVLYFYPQDNTPGCTVEACAFRDVYDDILAKGAVVIGISADSGQSHSHFKKKYSLPFYLAADPEKKVINAFGVWAEKMIMGKPGTGIVRSTFIIDENGMIMKVFPKVSPKEHAGEVLAVL
jgi:peroxiredoxin Q/BCP